MLISLDNKFCRRDLRFAEQKHPRLSQATSTLFKPNDFTFYNDLIKNH